jgi:hypothetical protein
LLIDNAYITNTSIYHSPYTGGSSGKLIITNSVIQDNPSIYLWYPESDCLFEGNVFINSGPVSVGTHDNVKVTFRNNFFYKPTSVVIENWASYSSSLTNVENNSFFSDEQIVLQLKYSSGAMIAKNNFWNTTDSNVIEKMIYDRKDNLLLSSTIEYEPFLMEHDLNTPNPFSDDRDHDSLPDLFELLGESNMYDADTDNDGVNDNQDAFPIDPTETLDTDEDGIGNNADVDDDNDGIADDIELLNGSDPLDRNSFIGTTFTIHPLNDINKDGVADWIKYTTHSNRVEVNLFSGSRYNALTNYVIENSFDTPSTVLLGDRDADGINEVGVFGFDASLNRYQLQVHSGLTGAKQDVWNWPAILGEVKFQALADLTGDGIQEYAISGVHLVNGTRQLVVKDGVSKSTYQTFKWPNLWDKPQFVTMSDVTFDNVPEVALYGRHSRLDKGQLFIFDGANADSKVDVYNWNTLWSDIQLVEMDDVDGYGTIDWGQFGQRKDDGRYQWVVKKGNDKRGVIRTFSWPNDLVDVSPMLVADRTGDGIREVAVLGTSPDSGKVFVRINDGRFANTRIANISWPASWEDIQVSELGDLNNDGFSEFGLLGFTKSNRTLQLVIRDGASFAEYGRVSFAGQWENVSVMYDATKGCLVMLGTDQKTTNNIAVEIDTTSLQSINQYVF